MAGEKRLITKFNGLSEKPKPNILALRNPFYYGDFYWKGTLYHGTHKRLIEKDLWDKVQELLNQTDNKNEPKSKYGTKPFAFKGLLVCGECGRTVTAEKVVKKSGKESSLHLPRDAYA